MIVPLLILCASSETRRVTATSARGHWVYRGFWCHHILVHGHVHAGYGALLGFPAAARAVGGASLQAEIPDKTVEYCFALLLIVIAVWLALK